MTDRQVRDEVMTLFLAGHETTGVPIAWEELTPSLTSDHFTIANLPRRLAGLKADPWAGYWTPNQGL
jgi:DNA primase